MQNERTEIIQLKPECWEILKDLKLRSVAEEPVAFDDFDRLIENYATREDREWEKWLNEEKRVSVFAKSEGKFVGMVSAVLGNNTAYVQHMYVENESRGKGLGKSLLVSLLSEVKSRGMKRATLGVLESQTTAINLYESLGFTTATTIEVTRSGKAFQELLMEKTL